MARKIEQEYVIGQPPDRVFDALITLEPEGSETRLTVIQTGFPDDQIADEFYNGCVKGWQDTLTSFRKTLEERE